MAKFHYRESPTLKQKKAFAPYLSEDEELILITGYSHAHLRNQFVVFMMMPGIIFALLGAAIAWFFKLDLAFIIGIAVLLMILISLIKTLHLYHSNRYLLTTRRVMIKKGIFSVKLTAVLFDKITHIEVDQSFFDRILLHHGDIIINTAGLNKDDFILKYVDYPMELKNLLERLINREKEQSGIRSTSTVEGEIIE